MKKAVSFAYLDYGSLDARRKFCETELALNRRTAPALYLRTVPVTRRTGGELEIDGTGEAVEWLVEMARFDQESILDALAERGDLTAEIVEAAASEIARFHRTAETSEEYGGAEGMRHVIDGIGKELRKAPAAEIDADSAARWERRAREWLARDTSLLDRRRADGKVRRCHGDMHLRNICLLDGKPVLFDAIEFSDDIGTIDILYDLAFLLMDLEHRGQRTLANTAFNAYLSEMPDEIEGLAALPLFLSCRAAVRAHVTAASHAAAGDGLPDREAQAYLDAAISYLDPPAPKMVCVGGLSGSGKSTAARLLAPSIEPAPGALIVRSDVIRKRLAGVAATDKLPPEAYTPKASAQVYQELERLGLAAVAAGHSAVLDAVFARPGERTGPERLAAEAGVAFAGYWLDAGADTMEERVRGRTNDASDAGPDVLKRQLDYVIGTLTWRIIDAGGSREETVRRISDDLQASAVRPAARN
jgi:aminoglycoside phosphotransferase family enzyme/predicted kinase